MKPLIDIDELENDRHIKIIITIISFSVLVLLVSGVFLYAHKKSANQSAILTSNTQSSGSNDAQTTTHSLSTPTSPTTTDSSQTEAQDNAQAAQDEANAAQDLKNAESGQTALDNETPPPSPSSTPTISVPAPTTPLPTPTCTGSSEVTSTYSAYIQAEGALNSFEQDPSASVDTYGLDAAVVEAEEQSKLSSLESAENQAQSAYEAAEASFTC